MMAIKAGQAANVDILTAENFSKHTVNTHDANGETPLHYAGLFSIVFLFQFQDIFDDEK
jgi:hypothetical protein